MSVRTLFPTRLYEGQVDVSELAASVRALAAEDRAGQRWCREHGYRGYTSYASLDDLPYRDPAFADLVRALDKHVAAFAKASGFHLAKRLKLDSLWVNLLKPGAAHSGHIHPHSVVSGTVYVETPPGCRRDPVRGPPPAADDGGAAQRRRTLRGGRAASRAWCCCGKAGCGTRSSPVTPKPSGSASASTTPEFVPR